MLCEWLLTSERQEGFRLQLSGFLTSARHLDFQLRLTPLLTSERRTSEH